MPWKNTPWTLGDHIQAQHDNFVTRVVVALDTAKALEWPYLWECLRGHGIGPNFIKWVQLLYQSPKARVFVNGWLSDQFPLERCPLSPLLYALAAEPLAIAIRVACDVDGLRLGTSLEKNRTLCRRHHTVSGGPGTITAGGTGNHWEDGKFLWAAHKLG